MNVTVCVLVFYVFAHIFSLFFYKVSLLILSFSLHFSFSLNFEESVGPRIVRREREREKDVYVFMCT